MDSRKARVPDRAQLAWPDHRMMQPPRSDELAAELSSVRPRNERKLALNTGAAMWMIGLAGVLAASFAIPELVTSDVGMWRGAWATLSLVMALSHLTWMKKLRQSAYEFAIVASSCIWVIATAALMPAAPIATAALTLNLLPPTMYGAFFFRTRAIVAVLLLATLAAIVPVVYDYEAALERHVLSWLTVLIPVIWLLALVVMRQRKDRTIASLSAESQVFSDSLTGISNNRALAKDAAGLLDVDRSYTRVGALLLVDIDDLGAINRELGQHAGDDVLRAVGRSLSRAASGNHLVARTSGNVFAVLIESAAACDVDDIAIRYRNAVRGARCEPDLPGLRVDATIGVAVHESGATTLEELMTSADASLNDRKRQRGGRKSTVERPVLPNEFQQLPVEYFPESTAVIPEKTDDDVPLAGVQRPQRSGERVLLGRPDYALLSGAAWFFAITIVLLSLATPDADRSMIEIAVPFLLICYLAAAMNLFFAPAIGSLLHMANDALTLTIIAVGAYLLGGGDGPGWLIILLFIAYAGWFMNVRSLLLRLIGPILVILAPLVYENLGAGSTDAGTVVTLYAGVVIACTVGLAMGFNRLYMERAHTTAEWLASLDPLTGIANRGAFEHHLVDQLETLPYQAEDALAVVMIDLNGFHRVNRERGYAAGDELLVKFASKMRRSLREGDLLARTDGDEFAVVLKRVGAKEATLAAERLIGVIHDCAQSVQGRGGTTITASAGFALYPIHGRTLDELVNAAELALTTVKSGSQTKSRVSRIVMGL